MTATSVSYTLDDGLSLPGEAAVDTAPPAVTTSRDVLSRSLDRTAPRTTPAEQRAARAAARRAALTPAERTLQRVLSDRAVRRAAAAADTRLWATAPLNLWRTPAADSKQAGLLDEGQKVLVTGRSLRGREEVVVGGTARWVTAGYLSDEDPTEVEETEDATAGSGTTAARGTGGTCTNGSSVPSGVSAGVVATHEAVCARWPEITSYGTFRSDGEHSQGLAIDVMVSGDLGWDVADYLRANYSALDIEYLIYAQHIWSVERASEGWRPMEDRGSTTANHYDHVHVTTY
ncbi:hypothetical protein [Nocardioides bruguierae]|uniref:ARB-07466-like C-terminal domain-containing protein n=1 Tax=Nocardioides bruguierae TaxID=2945102 RepID=A0A9X2DBD7_9ACTN|nr:hypothetical protein [Nocardioides bruguierae]MCM0622277.1 hypothetical protein [Nocardioides bruguierae]